MNAEQVDRLIDELSETRKSLDSAVKAIRWNKINTVIQYVLLFAVFLMGTIGVAYYFNDRRDQCDRDNNLRAAVNDSFDTQAGSIGIALSVVSNASPEKLQQYIEVYRNQPRPEALSQRSC